MIIILFFILQQNIFSLYTYNSFQTINYLKSIKANESELYIILKEISKTFSEAYAYNEISKNPPQPFFDNNYHNKVDIQKLLSEINIINVSFYEFYKNIIKQISELKDLHIDIYFNNNNIFNLLKDLYAICPIKFEINKINGEYQIFGKPNKYYQYYDKDIIDLIQNNYNNNRYILSINNLNPFNFISDFCGNIGKTKNKHGTFSHKFNAHYGYNLAVFPMDNSDLNLEIKYNNGDIINIEYIFVSTIEKPELNKIDKDDKKINQQKNDILFNEFINKKNLEHHNNKIKLGKLQKEFNKYMNISNNHSFKYERANINWDLEYDNKTNNILKCRVDELNKVDIYYIRSFSNDNHKLYKETFLNCVSLFDKNEYPIIVILNKNDGGFADLSKLLLELISPFVSIAKYMTTKVNINKNTNNSIIKINYGNNISGYVSKPEEDLVWLNNEIIEYKKNIKNKRSPTDILIFTDGYSFSAASIFIKYLQYYGGAIIAGFFGDPRLKNVIFDSGQSASSIFYNDTLYFISNSYRNLNDNYNISMNMPGNQYFFDDLNLNIPLEYLVFPVDERVNIFHHFKDDYYDIFIKEALKIFDKYKTRCNPNNKKLIYLSDKCKNKFENDHTYGGYECDDNGFWSKKCVIMYCDIEYVFNHQLNKCVLRKKMTDFLLMKKILITIIFFLIIIMLIINFDKETKNKDDENDSNEEELVDFSENYEKN